MGQENWQVVTNKKESKVKQTEPIKFDPIPSRQKQQTQLLNPSNSSLPLPSINLNSSNSTHQDWNTVTLSKPQPKPKITQTQYQASGIKLDETGDIIKIKKVSSQMAKAVIDARIVKKWSQIQLAQNACVDLKSLSEIERGGCVYNADMFNKIAKTLGIKIDRNVDIK